VVLLSPAARPEEAGRAAQRSGAGGRRARVVALLAAFAITRFVCSWLADHPDAYAFEGTFAYGDVVRYESWARDLLEGGRAPYSEVAIEYPPGSLPFISAPLRWGSGVEYRSAFIVTMVLVDAFGLLALVRMAPGARFGGAWAWVALVPLVGPLSYLRLDLVPAVATLWALERAAIGSWLAAGSWLGYGAAAKLYPGLLLPAAWLGSGRRGRLLAGAALLAGVAALPFLGNPAALWDSVLGYHSQRGIQIESTWGAALVAAARFGYPAEIVYDFGAFHIRAGVAQLLEAISVVASIGAVVGGVLLARDTRPTAPGPLAGTLVLTLSLLLVTGTVLSPQYLLWLAALVAAWFALDPIAARGVLALVAIAAALTQLVYPVLYTGLLALRAIPLTVLVARNLLLAASAAMAWSALRAGTRPP
jgi:hypothetical protein